MGVAPASLTRIRPGGDDPIIPLPISLAIHVATILLLIYAVHRRLLTPPPPQSGIAVVFQNSGLPHSATHNASPKALLRGTPQVATLPPPPPPPPSPPAPRPAPEVNLGLMEPLPFVSPMPLAPAKPPPPHPAHRRPALPSHHFMVMDGMSFGSHQTTVRNRAPGAINLAPAQSDLSRPAPSITFKGNAGPDWESAFNKWVNKHAYYPQSAADNGEHGRVTISFTVLPDGRVIDLHMVDGSGAPLLDMAWLGLFRDVHVPRFPPGSKAKSEHVVATMHYILIH